MAQPHKEISPHAGHRERLKHRFLEEGLDGFTDEQALELLLFYAIPRQDTNLIAHALMNHFGSLAQVLEAPAGELMKIPGIGEHGAVLLQLVTQMGRMYQKDRAKQVKILSSVDEIGQYLLPYFYGRTLETVFLLCMDAKCKVLTCRNMGEGGINSASISPRKIVEAALAAGATTVVLAHNHPSGVAVPSLEDIQTTRRVAAALAAVEIHLADHIVVADDDYVSLAQSGHRLDVYALP